MTIAVDFDGTIVKHEFPAVGELIPGAVRTLQTLAKFGCEIILWTCREGNYLEDAVNFCKENKIPIHSVNRNSENLIGYAVRKIVASLYIDDRGIWPGRMPGTNLEEKDWTFVRGHILTVLGVSEIDEPKKTTLPN